MECGEGKQKEGEEIVFYYAAVVQKQEIDREMHSVFFTTHRPGAHLFPPLLNNNPIAVHRTPAVGAVV